MSDQWVQIVVALIGTNGLTGLLAYRAASLKERRTRYSEVEAAATRFDKKEINEDDFKAVARRAGVSPAVVKAYTTGAKDTRRQRILEDYLWHPWSRRAAAIVRARRLKHGLGE